MPSFARSFPSLKEPVLSRAVSADFFAWECLCFCCICRRSAQSVRTDFWAFGHTFVLNCSLRCCSLSMFFDLFPCYDFVCEVCSVVLFFACDRAGYSRRWSRARQPWLRTPSRDGTDARRIPGRRTAGQGIAGRYGGQLVQGYRAPSFSIGPEDLWAFDTLLEAGHRYSSSVYPIRHDHYGMPDAPRFPFRGDRNCWRFRSRRRVCFRAIFRQVVAATSAWRRTSSAAGPSKRSIVSTGAQRSSTCTLGKSILASRVSRARP